MNNVYLIPSSNMGRLVEEIAKLNRRADKIGCKPVVFTDHGVVVKKQKDPTFGFEYDAHYHQCTVSGESPRLNGWSLVAAVEPLPNGENLVREVPGQNCPESFRTTGMKCEHCGFDRRRTAIFVLAHEDGTHKQVGRNCIADFLGHDDPESMLSGASYLMDFGKLAGEATEESWGGGRGEVTVNLHQFVTTASIVARRLGWLPRSKATAGETPTADIAWSICTRPNDRYVKELVRDKNIHAEDRDAEVAQAAIEWAAAITSADSNYLHDLGVCCRQVRASRRTMGFAASVVNAYQRNRSEVLSRELSAAKPQAKAALGTVGDRVVFADLTITHASSYTSGQYPKTFVRFVDAGGNVIVWRASGSPDWVEIGKKVTVKGTVKKHDVFNNVPQTVIERVVTESTAVVASAG